MNIKTKVILTTFVVAVPAFITGHMIWPPSPESIPPTAGQLPFFMILNLFESVSFGLGVSFLLFGWPFLKRLDGKADTLTKAAFFSIVWLMGNWWTHDNLHIHNGMNTQGLLYIEYGFHVTMMVAASVLAKFFIDRILKQKTPS